MRTTFEEPEEEPDGEKLKEQGMQRALSAAQLKWKEDFRKYVVLLARFKEPFTSEDVISLVGLPTGEVGLHKNNAVGAMMNGMARRGIIQKTGYHVPSKRPESHGAELTQWIGV